MKHPHYHKSVAGRETIDVYDVLALFEVKSHPVGHAIKKLLMAGKRGAKDYRQDLQEAVDSILREIDMQTPAEPEKRATGDSGPSWDDAPEWAQWLAQDCDGEWFWYGGKPQCDDEIWFGGGNACDFAVTGEKNPNWRNTLQQRPTP